MLDRRARRGKEDPARIRERFGYPAAPRPQGKLLWLHGASVGESLILLELVQRLSDTADLEFLVTTGTTTSAKLMSEKLPERARHQYIPIDRLAPVKRFLDHWKPDAAVFVESELWPNLLLEIQKRGFPAALVNARMNEKSLANWRKRPQAARHLLSAFSWIGAADDRTAKGLSDLTGHNVPRLGNLKLQIAAPSADDGPLAIIRTAIGERPVWLAASTHDGEEGILLDAHRKYLQARPGALLILAPRHPERGDGIAHQIAAAELTFARRSRDETPAAGVQVWLADTLGEMAYWYALADQAFIGGSLRDGIGGHNPIEATQAGCPIMTGPYTASFEDVFAAYRAHNGVAVVETPDDIVNTLQLPTEDLLENAHRALEELTGNAMDETLVAIHSLLHEDRQ
ncbi:3-deoxy-D-manno-octulosonic acid transferase [Hyphobacterium sp.]|uniref:3-deoxy-D-manno-octulosonic acid transferase n=1 Tax=Hyphobacterium sp. TaxID=2004662 RepID=UPI003749474C